MKFKQWVDEKGFFHHTIEVEDFDTWNADNTLAIVINAVMQRYLELRETGGCAVDLEDIPPHIKYKRGEHDPEGKVFCEEAFYWIVEEIVWATGQAMQEDYLTQTEENDKRQRNAMKLFGKYFFGFWN